MNTNENTAAETGGLTPTKYVELWIANGLPASADWAYRDEVFEFARDIERAAIAAYLAKQEQAEPKCKCGNTMNVCAVTSCENAMDTGLATQAPVAQAKPNPGCPECKGTGLADSGGVQPWGEPISIPCGCEAPGHTAVPLKPCPFCGGQNVKTNVHRPLLKDDEPDAYCQCEDCTAIGPNGTDQVSAVAAWDRRAESAAIPRGGEDQLKQMLVNLHREYQARAEPIVEALAGYAALKPPAPMVFELPPAEAKSAGDSAPVAQAVPEDSLTVVRLAASSILHSHRIEHLRDDDDQPYPLVDLLSKDAPDTIATGKAEIDEIVEAICDEFRSITKTVAAPTITAASAQTAPGEVRDQALEDVAKLIEKKVEAYDQEHGSYDHSTGVTEYPGDGAEWVCEMEELAEEIRSLKGQTGAATQDTNGSEA